MSSLPILGRHHVLAVSCLAAALLGCAKRSAAAPDAAATAAGPLVEITVIGTSDLHGRLDRLPLFAGYVAALRRARPGRVVLVDAGDTFQGTLESDLGEGVAVLRAYRALGYHALTIGNHEFDYGPVGPAATPRGPGDDPRGALKRLARLAKGAFPFLAANLREGGHPPRWDNVRPAVLVRLPCGVRVGIIGVTTRAMARVTHAANFSRMRTTAPAAAVVREARRLRRRGADLVVVAAHAGARCSHLGDERDTSSCAHGTESLRIARALPPGLVDVIIGAHTHGASAHRVNGIAVVQAYAKGKAFARVDLLWDPRTRTVVRSRIHRPTRVRERSRYAGVALREDATLTAIVAEAKKRARRRRQEPVGVTLTGTMRRRYAGESALGNFVTSMMLEAEPGADVAIYNGGGLRANLAPGVLRYGQLYDALPFGNTLVVVAMTGAQLRRLLRRNLRSRGSFLSIAGARVRARCAGGDLRVSVRLRGRGPLRASERVRVVTSDYLAAGGGGFPRALPVLRRDGVLRDRLAARLRKRAGRVNPRRWYRRARRRIRFHGRRPVRCH